MVGGQTGKETNRQRFAPASLETHTTEDTMRPTEPTDPIEPLSPLEKKQWHGDCPTCAYSHNNRPFHSGMSLCIHPAGCQVDSVGLVSKCDGWKEAR